jgi:branched-chain amino acid transport system substrate-binding protein
MTRMKAANPQAVLCWVTGTPLGTVLRGLKEAGLDIPTVVTYSNMTYSQMSSYAAFLPAQLYFPTLLGTIPGVLGKGPVSDAQAVYSKALKAVGARPEVGQNLTWDPTMLVVDALRHAGPNATADQVRDFILHAHGWVGINGVYDFASGDQHGIGENAVAIARWDAGKGTWVAASRPRGLLAGH